MSLANLYKSHIPHCRFIFKDGSIGQFQGNQFVTTVPQEILEMDAEIANKNPAFYIEPGMRQVDPEDLDPVLVFKKKVIAEYLANQAAASGNAARDMGKTEPQKLTPASTVNIAALTLGNAPTTFAVPKGLAAALELATPQADQPTHVPDGAKDIDPDALAGLNALSVFK